MGRYVCQQGKIVTIVKANKVCLLRRCPDLQVVRSILEKGRLKHITIPVVLESYVDINGRC